jgi:molybdenum cofactor cytidylyltransferase
MARCDAVFVVLGAYRREVRAALADLDVIPIDNAGWEVGVGSSIRAGVLGLERHASAYTAVLMVTVDQYQVDRSHLDRLCAAHDAGHGLVASSYAGTVGIPALFGERYFPDLLRIGPSRGAKALLVKRRDEVLAVPCPQALVDLDTQDDLDILNRHDRVS